MKFLVGTIAAIVLAVGIFSIASAQQPRTDEVDIDLIGCSGGTVEWIDGTQVATKVQVSNADTGVVIASVTLDDIVGDQSGNVLSFDASPGTKVRATLFIEEDDTFVDTATIPACPTSTPTATATSTSTPAPTQTPVATLTPLPTVTPTPVVIVQQVPVYIDRVVTQTITPPSTGNGGLLIRE